MAEATDREAPDITCHSETCDQRPVVASVKTVTLFISLPRWEAHESDRRHRRAKETIRRHRQRVSTQGVGSQAGGVLGFAKLIGRVDASTSKGVCEGLEDTTEELYDDAERAVKVRDLRSLNKLVEELRWSEGAAQACRIR